MELRKHQFAIMSVLSLSLLIVFFHRFALGVVSDDLTRSLALSASGFSSIGAVYFYVYGFMQLPVGFLADSLGPRKICAVGMLLAALGSILFGLAQTFSMAFLGRLLVSLGVSGVFLSILKIQAVWFHPRQFSALSGITSAVGNIGSVLAVAPFAYVVMQYGWRSSFFLMGVLSLFSAIAIYFVVRDTPEEKGLQAPYPLTPKKHSLWHALQSVAKNPKTWPAALTLGGLMGSTLALGGVWGVMYLMQAAHLPKDVASSVLSFLTLGFLVGSPITGILSSRWNMGKRIVNVGACMGLLPFIFLLFFPATHPTLWAFLFFILGAFGITFILSFTNVKENNDPAFSGLATSVVNFFGFSASAIISLLAGAVLEASWDGALVHGVPVYSFRAFQGAIGVIFAFYLVGTISSFFFVEEGKGTGGRKSKRMKKEEARAN